MVETTWMEKEMHKVHRVKHGTEGSAFAADMVEEGKGPESVTGIVKKEYDHHDQKSPSVRKSGGKGDAKGGAKAERGGEH